MAGSAIEVPTARRDPAISDHYNGGCMKIPVISTACTSTMIAADLVRYGIAVVDVVRPQDKILARELRGEFGLADDAGAKSDEEDFLLHLACKVEPESEYGWVDYYVYSATFPLDPMRAKELVCAAVRQWGTVGKPDYFVAKLNP